MPHPKPTDWDMTKHSDYFVWKTRQSAWLGRDGRLGFGIFIGHWSITSATLIWRHHSQYTLLEYLCIYIMVSFLLLLSVCFRGHFRLCRPAADAGRNSDILAFCFFHAPGLYFFFFYDFSRLAILTFQRFVNFFGTRFTVGFFCSPPFFRPAAAAGGCTRPPATLFRSRSTNRRPAAAAGQKNWKNRKISRVWSWSCGARQLGAEAPSPPRARVPAISDA